MQKRHNPLTFYMRELMYMILALLIRLVALAPLAFLFVFPEGSYWRYLALLCPLLIIFVVLPLRFSFAEAMVQKPRQRFFSFDSALGMGMYGEKLGESLLHALNLLKWGIPFLLMAGGCCYYYYSTENIATIMSRITEIGRFVVGVYNSVANFFIRLFGSINTLTYQGGLGEGLYTIGAALGVGLLIWLWGAVRNSSTRYIWVLATRAERSPRVEIRRRLRGRRWRQFLVGLINLVLWAPFVWVLSITLKDVFTGVSGNQALSLYLKKLQGVDLIALIKPLAFAFFCLYFPLLPVRRWITATFSSHEARHIAPKQPAGETTPVAVSGEPYAHDGPSPFSDLGEAAEYEAAPVEAHIQPKPAVFSAASESAPEPTPMAAEEPPEEPQMQYYTAQPVEQPVEHYAAQPVEQPTQYYAAQPVEQPVEHYTAQPVEQPEEPPMQYYAAQPVEQPSEAHEERPYTPYDAAEAEATEAAAAEPQPTETVREPAYSPSDESEEKPANDPPTFTLGQ